MPNETEVMRRAAPCRARWAACVVLALGALAASGCEVQSSSDAGNGGSANAAGGGSTTENETTDAAGLPKPAARSALGKAKERAEKLINEDVAEYNKKIEQAAEGKYP